MKFFAVFAAVLALAAGSPHAWTLQELSDALQNPHTNPEYIPYLEHALNQMMEELHAGKPVVSKLYYFNYGIRIHFENNIETYRKNSSRRITN